MRFAVVAALGALACASPPPFVPPSIALTSLPGLGDVVEVPPGPPRTAILVSPAQTYPSYETNIDGIPFTLGIDRDTNRVRYVATNDRHFLTPEKVHAGSSRDEALRAAPGGSLRTENGWGEFVQLPSGWKAFVDRKRVIMVFLRD